MSATQSAQSAEIAARLDRLPASRYIWHLVLLLSLGGVFEFYELFYTGYVAPGLIKSGLFSAQSLGPLAGLGLLGIGGFGTFVFFTFFGMFIGTLALGFVADHYGRRAIFTGALLWYSVATVVMAFMTSGFWVNIWRMIATIGLGIELVTIDTYISELVPAAQRGRAYAYNQFITFAVVPVVALISWWLVPVAPLGFAGWRWVVLIGATGAVIVWWIRLGLPESPRWLANHGRFAEADAITRDIEARVAAESGPLPPPAPGHREETGRGSFAEIMRPPYRSRTIMLSVFNFFQTIGFYGFNAWVPTLLLAKGIAVTKSLEWSFIIAIANPFGPLLGAMIADRMERKWQICCAALGMAVFMYLFAIQNTAGPVIVFGVGFTLCANWLSFAFHNYQSELFPTRVRSRAIGFVYSWSRVSSAFAGLFIGFLVNAGGAVAVALFIAASMAMVIVSIGGFGPATRGRSLEAINAEA